MIPRADWYFVLVDEFAKDIFSNWEHIHDVVDFDSSTMVGERYPLDRWYDFAAMGYHRHEMFVVLAAVVDVEDLRPNGYEHFS